MNIVFLHLNDFQYCACSSLLYSTITVSDELVEVVEFVGDCVRKVGGDELAAVCSTNFDDPILPPDTINLLRFESSPSSDDNFSVEVLVLDNGRFIPRQTVLTVVVDVRDLHRTGSIPKRIEKTNYFIIFDQRMNKKQSKENHVPINEVCRVVEVVIQEHVATLVIEVELDVEHCSRTVLLVAIRCHS